MFIAVLFGAFRGSFGGSGQGFDFVVRQDDGH